MKRIFLGLDNPFGEDTSDDKHWLAVVANAVCLWRSCDPDRRDDAC
jgi:hypothetical protein